MNKIKLGNDFTDESQSDESHGKESDEKTTDEESEDEKENSADTDDSKKPEESDESVEDKSEAADDKKSDEAPDKSAVLQGLLDTEKDLDKDTSTIDEAIVAARGRISDKRKERREKRDIVDTIDTKFPDTENIDDLSDIDTDTLKVLDRYTKSKGLVPKSEFQKLTYQERHKDAEESFYTAHPEYLPENDKDDALYNALKRELADFVAPSNPKDILKKFEKAHTFVKQTHPDKFKSKGTEYNSEKNTNSSVRIKARALGGSSGGGEGKSGSSDSAKKSFSESQIRALQDGGWSEEEIKTLIN